MGKEYMPKRKSIIARRSFPSRASACKRPSFFLLTWAEIAVERLGSSRHHAWQHVSVKEQRLYLIIIMLSCNHLVSYLFLISKLGDVYARNVNIN